MDVIEVPSHFMENYVNDARTLPLFMPDSNKASTAKKAEAMAKQVKQDRHMFGALDLETQASFATYHMRVATCHRRVHRFYTQLYLVRVAAPYRAVTSPVFDWFAVLLILPKTQHGSQMLCDRPQQNFLLTMSDLGRCVTH